MDIFKDYVELVDLFDNHDEQNSIARRLKDYADSLYDILPNNQLVDDLINGLKIMHIYASYQDKIIDSNYSSKDSMMSLIYHTRYLKWLSKYGKNEIDLFLSSMETFITYSTNEILEKSNFDYTLDSYIDKISPIEYHLSLMNRMLKNKYEKQLNFVKMYYVAILHVDDIEDFVDDYATSKRRTAFGECFLNRFKDGNKPSPESYEYWLFANQFLIPWLESKLREYSDFSKTKIYKQVLLIYDGIKRKIEL